MKRLTLFLLFLFSFLSAPVGFCTMILDDLSFQQAREQSADINRKIIHQSVQHPSSLIHKNFNKKSKQDVLRFKNATLYIIDAEIDTILNRIKAKQHITYTHQSSQPTSVIYCRIYPNNPTNVMRKDNVRFNKIEINRLPATYEVLGTILEIELPQPLTQHESINIYLEFSQLIPEITPPPQSLFGLMNPTPNSVAGYTDYGVYGYHRDIFSLGHWFPIITPFQNGEWFRSPIARNGDIQFFEPAIIKATIETTDDMIVAASGIKIQETASSNTKRKKSTFLAFGFREMGLQISNVFTIAEKKVDDVLIQAYFSKNNPDFGKKILEVGVKALQTFNKLIGPYPYSELKIVESYLTNGAGGMEFPGLVTVAAMFHSLKMDMGPFALLYGNNTQAMETLMKPFLEDTIESTVAHEVAHQWWNTVVGNDSINSGWTDEALTNYFTLLYYDDQYGEKKFEDMKFTTLKLPVLFAKFSGTQDAPVDLSSAQYDDSMQYSITLYSKGPYYYDHIRTLIGPTAFLKASQTYFQQYYFSFAKDHAFSEIIKKQNPRHTKDIDALYDRWIKGTYLYTDVEGNYIAYVAEMAGSKFPSNIDLDKGLLPSLMDILGGSKKVLK